MLRGRTRRPLAHRALKTAGYDVYEIDPASVAVDRRARRAKSDGVDVDKLVGTLARLVRGELDACRVVAIPSEAEEDAKRPHREYERLVKEQTAHRNRVKALLFAQGIRDFDPMASDRLQRLAALPIMPRLKAELPAHAVAWPRSSTTSPRSKRR